MKNQHQSRSQAYSMCKSALLSWPPKMIAFAPIFFFGMASHDAFADIVSPSIGLTAGQTARLSVVNNGSTTQTESLSLVDDLGNVLATKMAPLAPAHRLSLDFTTNLSRLEIHGIAWGGPTETFPADLQIFDTATMKTLALTENFQPSPPTAFGTFVSSPLGVTAGQTARVSVVNDGTTTENETLSIVDGLGRILAQRAITLSPGQAGSLDFIAGSSRVQIHCSINPTAFPASLQVFDSASLQTIALVENFNLLPAVQTTATSLISSVVGFAPGQIARLSIVNTNTVSASQTLSIVDGRGVSLKTATVNVAPGRTASIQARTPTSRAEIHGIVIINSEPAEFQFPAALEVMDAETLKTMALAENFVALPPDPLDTLTVTSPTIGFGAGQTARLSVVNNHATAETDTLSIVNGLGVTIKTATISVPPGRTAFIQTTTPNSRLEIHGIIIINSEPAPEFFPGSLQVFDSFTQETLARLEDFSAASP